MSEMNNKLSIQLRKLKNLFETENIVIIGDTEEFVFNSKEYTAIRINMFSQKQDVGVKISDNVHLKLDNGIATITVN